MITTCRGCASPNLRTVLDLGLIASAEYDNNPDYRSVKWPLQFGQCLKCKLVQLVNAERQEGVYQQYWYRSGVNETMKAELKDVVETARRIVNLQPQNIVIDIGANDGTLLSNYRGQYRVAFEPAPNLQVELSRQSEVVYSEFFPSHIQSWEGSAKIVTAIACAYAVDDIHGFLEGVRAVLHKDGVAIIQFQDLKQMLDATAFDNICLPPDSPIITKEGLRPIETIKPGTLVLTAPGDYYPVEQVHNSHYEGELVELIAYGFGYTLRVTPNHPVRVQRKGKWDWVPAEDVQRGDVVCRPTPHANTDIPVLMYKHGRGRDTTRFLDVSETFLEVAGYYLAEGCIGSRNNGVTFYFGLSDEEIQLAERCKHLIERLGFTARIGRGTGTSTSVNASGPLARLLEGEFGRGAAKKHLPHWAFSLTETQSRVLIEAYAKGDGYRYRKSYWRIGTISDQLALDIAMLSNRAGWHASLCLQQKPHLSFKERKRPSVPKPAWDILIQTKPQKKMKVWLDGNGNQCGRIRSIKRVPYKGEVYNLGVSLEHTYVTPAMTVHNCFEHLTYFSLASFEALAVQHGLTTVKVERRSINGGSLRVYLRHFTSKWQADISVSQTFAWELGCDRPAAMDRFVSDVTERKAQIKGVVDAARAAGQSADLYGASTKANTLLQVCGLSSKHIRWAWERSEEKWHKWQSATGIKIVPEAVGRQFPPDLLLVGVWQFRDMILQREAEYLRKGGTLCFPLPTVEMVSQ